MHYCIPSEMTLAYTYLRNADNVDRYPRDLTNVNAFSNTIFNATFRGNIK